MTYPNKYWTDHPAYRVNYPLLKKNHNGATWEMFSVEYKASLDFTGGIYIEFYRDGEFQESIVDHLDMSIAKLRESLNDVILNYDLTHDLGNLTAGQA